MDNKKLLEKVITTKKAKMFELIEKNLDKRDYIIINSKLWLFAIPINNITNTLLTAHIDTVKAEPKPDQLIWRGNTLTSHKDCGLGADDRAGVYAMLKIAKCSKMKPYLLFTDLEESGGIGAKDFVKNININEFDIHLIIELDRQGANEYVFYNPLPEQVAEYIESFGFVEHFGSFSDCKILTEKYKIPSVNVSVGYYNEHTTSEYLFYPALKNTILMVKDILSNGIGKLYPINEGNVKLPYDKWNYFNDGWFIEDDDRCNIEILDDDRLDEDILFDYGIIDVNGNCLVCGMPYKKCKCGEIEWFMSTQEYYQARGLL